jgi:membrane protein required for beta-lactamase induction
MTEWQDDDEFTTTYGTLKQSMQESHALERAYILHHLQKYYELTRFSQQVEGAEPNPEWDSGFQAAMSLVKGLPT